MRGGAGPRKNPFDVSDLSEALNTSSSDESSNNKMSGRKGAKKAGGKNQKPSAKNGVNKNKKLPPGIDFRPLADVFRTPESFTVHVALPGAKREDIKLAWRPKRGILVVSGTVARPADQALLKHLTRSERRVGNFRRRVRLGPAGKPAKIVAERIEATLEAGVLHVTVPKAPKTPKTAKQSKLEQEYVDVEKRGLI